MQRFLIFLFALASCSDKPDKISELIQRPIIKINAKKTFIDSIKLSPLSKKKIGYLEIACTGSILETVEFKTISACHLEREGQFLNEKSKLNLSHNAKTYLTFHPKQEGKMTIPFFLKNAFGSSDTATYQAFCFANLPPIAVLKVSQLKGKQSDWLLDASSSYDPDYNQGGGMVEYEFDIEGKEKIITAKSTANYAFESGQYLVRLRVKDNDGEWSNRVEEKIEIKNNQ